MGNGNEQDEYVELILDTYHECVRLEKAGEYALYLFESLVLAITLFKKILEKHNQILCKLCCFVASIPILFVFSPQDRKRQNVLTLFINFAHLYCILGLCYVSDLIFKRCFMGAQTQHLSATYYRRGHICLLQISATFVHLLFQTTFQKLTFKYCTAQVYTCIPVATFYNRVSSYGLNFNSPNFWPAQPLSSKLLVALASAVICWQIRSFPNRLLLKQLLLLENIRK